MIFASSMTWRSTASRVSRRYCSTPRSSAGSARTTMTPECGVIDDAAPVAPRRRWPAGTARSSPQKSFGLLRRDAARVDRARHRQVCPGSQRAGTGSAVGVGRARRRPVTSATEPDCTRTSLMPRRMPGQVIHAEYARLDARGLDRDARAVDAVFVAVEVAQRIERLLQRHVLEVHRDGAASRRDAPACCSACRSRAT